MQRFKLTILIMLFVSINIYAQLPNTLVKVFQDTSIGEVYHVEVSPDGTVFAAADSNLFALSYNDSSFVKNANIKYISDIRSMAFRSDGIIFLACGSSGLYACTYNNTSITCVAHIDSVYGSDVAVSQNGAIFLADFNNGLLRAYTFQDFIFKNIAHIHSYDPFHVTVANDSIIYTNGKTVWDGSIGFLCAYKYDGASFTKLAESHISLSQKTTDNPSNMKLGQKGTIFFTTKHSLRAYNLNDTTLNNIASLTGDFGGSLTIAPQGEIFISCLTWHMPPLPDYIDHGLHAYQYSDSLFFETAFINNEGTGLDLSVSQDGTIFVANGFSLIAYKYSRYTSIDDEPKIITDNFYLSQNYPNPFNPTTAISYQLPAFSQVDLSIYNILGQKVATLVSKKQAAGNYKVEWNANGFASGIYFYRLETDKGFVQSMKLILLK